MKTILFKDTYTLFALMLLILLIEGCGTNEQNDKKEKKVTDAIAVRTEKVVRKDIDITKVLSGTLEGEEQANVVAKIPERITAIKVKVGDYVKAGDLVATLDKTGASSQYYQAEAAFLNASKDLERMKALLKEGAISQQMFDGAQTAFNIAKANFEAARSVVELTAPISGVVISLNVSVGDIASPVTPLMSIASIGTMKVIFNPGEGDIAKIGNGTTVDLFSEQKPDIVIRARVTEKSKSADPLSRTFQVKALFPNTSDRWFMPGMFVKVKLNLDKRQQILVVPNVSLVGTGDSRLVYVVENGIAVQKTVKTGISDGTYTEIISGLNEGQEVVTIGALTIQNGSVVTVQNN